MIYLLVLLVFLFGFIVGIGVENCTWRQHYYRLLDEFNILKREFERLGGDWYKALYPPNKK